jgi:hypothetical protein
MVPSASYKGIERKLGAAVSNHYNAEKPWLPNDGDDAEVLNGL